MQHGRDTDGLADFLQPRAALFHDLRSEQARLGACYCVASRGNHQDVVLNQLLNSVEVRVIHGHPGVVATNYARRAANA